MRTESPWLPVLGWILLLIPVLALAANFGNSPSGVHLGGDTRLSPTHYDCMDARGWLKRQINNSSYNDGSSNNDGRYSDLKTNDDNHFASGLEFFHLWGGTCPGFSLWSSQVTVLT